MASRGQVIAGRYELTTPVGRGGMGEVWAAYDTRLDRRVALKLLRPDLLPSGTSGRSVLARFAREARLTARLEHPGVPAVFDVGGEDEMLYLVMQLVEGIDLAALLDTSGALPVDWAVAIAAQIATVLAAAHAVSLVHRDLKPRNVMLSRGGVVRVLDFGVAALLDPELTRVTAIGETVGSPAYMSPEQITSATVSPRSDLYALGCVLHELLAGEELFRAATTAARMYAHLERDPQPLGDLRSDVPNGVVQLVLDLLAKDPEARPAGAAEVYERLQPHLPTSSDAVAVDTDPSDPTRPYRCPMAPQLAPRTSLRPARTPLEPLAQVRQQALGLAEDGRFTQAAELLARRLRDAPYSPDDDLINARLQLAHTLLLGGEYRRALPEFEALVVALTERDGPDSSEVLRCRVQVATCRAELGELTTAIAELNGVLGRREQIGYGGTEVVDMRRQVALLLASSGDMVGAESALKELQRDREQVLGATHPEVAALSQLLSRVRARMRGSD